MGRLIDADAFLRKMNLAIVMMKHAMTDLDCEDDPELVMELKAYQDIRQGIKDEPTIEPERKTGKWHYSDTMYNCDQCGSGFYETSAFCPNCGADMRGESDVV